MKGNKEYNPLFSIIVPIYNTESVRKGALSRCIESILNQTYKRFELLLIDDGSTDNSSMICDCFAEQDDRIRVFHKENGGVSSARNYGLFNSNGVYIVFIDSDDYIEQEYLSVLANKKFKNYDLVCCANKVLGVNGVIESTDNIFSVSSNYLTQSDLITLLDHGYFVWAKRFSKAIIEQNQITFNERLDYGEDSLFFGQYLSNISSAISCYDSSYVWCRSNAETLSKYGTKLKYAEIMERLFDSYRDKQEIQSYILSKYSFSIEAYVMEISSSDDYTLLKKYRVIRDTLHNSFIRNNYKRLSFDKILSKSIHSRLYLTLFLIKHKKHIVS